MASLFLFQACALQTIHPPRHIGELRSPAEVNAYLKKNVDAKTLKRWDEHVSDDTVIVHLSVE